MCVCCLLVTYLLILCLYCQRDVFKQQNDGRLNIVGEIKSHMNDAIVNDATIT